MSSVSSDGGNRKTDNLARRDFLAKASAATVVGTIGVSLLSEPTAVADDKKPKDAPSKGPKESRKLLDLEHAHFGKFVGEQFVISRESKAYGKQSAMFTLTEAKDHKHPTDKRRPTNVRKSGFTLVFRAETGEKLEDGIWRLEHSKLGQFELFLHKTKRDKEPKRVFFVATFN